MDDLLTCGRCTICQRERRGLLRREVLRCGATGVFVAEDNPCTIGAKVLRSIIAQCEAVLKSRGERA